MTSELAAGYAHGGAAYSSMNHYPYAGSGVSQSVQGQTNSAQAFSPGTSNQYQQQQQQQNPNSHGEFP
ncbi:hypothetical protein Slin15195_G098670 [Septoria linicola]|uniref:Uncharacterized protein n=1 Tax=Septoria linicola TaxID=215465 RepID=A0A9Q9B2W2_9PEZI|nr:hypothetical protein Slin14017_G061730 [Septoria linicola]USW56548.1 hypothetical protein Slin15195_G098670 [Septoria linicola]